MSKTHRKHYGYDERRAAYRHARREDRQHMPETIERAMSEQDEDRREREQQGRVNGD